MAQTINDRQRQILEFIRQHIETEGYPPTVREICAAVGIRSTNGVNEHLKVLERKGYIERMSNKSRTLRPLMMPDELPDPTFNDGVDVPTATVTSLDAHRRAKAAKARSAGAASRAHSDDPGRDMVTVPILGKVAAGMPLLAEERHEDSLQIDSFLLGGHRRVFGLKVKGDSMIGDGIFDGDYIFVKKQLHAEDGEIVVAMIEGEATVKRFYREGDRVRFQPSNPRLEPIYVRKDQFRETMILGIVVGVYRQLG